MQQSWYLVIKLKLSFRKFYGGNDLRKNSLKITQWQSETVNLITDKVMVKRIRTN
jgi:hypothetical protein